MCVWGSQGSVFFRFLVSWSLQLFWPRKIHPGGYSVFLLPAHPVSSLPLFPRGVSLQSAPARDQEGVTRNPLQCHLLFLTGSSWSPLALLDPLLQVPQVGEGTETKLGLEQASTKPPRNV